MTGNILRNFAEISRYFEYSVVDNLTKDGIAVSKAVYSSRRPEIQAEVHPSLASLWVFP